LIVHCSGKLLHLALMRLHFFRLTELTVIRFVSFLPRVPT